VGGIEEGCPRMADELLTTEELAGRLKVSIAAIESWRSSGEGPPYVRVVKAVRYRLSDVDKWIEEQTFANVAAERAAAEQAGREFRQGRPPRAGQD
jgi:predicted DNA-binding transcriptional regulator AlpA